MKIKSIISILSICLFFSSTTFASSTKSTELVKVKMSTSHGDIELELNKKKAPITVKNFLQYAKDGFYKGTIFHRVINGFMIQGGGFTKDLQRKETRKAITNEADNGLSNEEGTIAMARTSDINSATSQFFINVNNNSSLNHTSKNPRGYGYAVFGRVIKGMSIVNKIKLTKTTVNGPHRNFPADPIIIKEVKIIK